MTKRTSIVSPSPARTAGGRVSQVAPHVLSERQSALAAEARRWAREHQRAEAEARRVARAGDELRADGPEDLAEQFAREALRMRLRFHRALEQLVVVGGYSEAKSILREREEGLARGEGDESARA